MTWTAEVIFSAVSLNHSFGCVREIDLVEITKLTPAQVEHACLKLRKHGLLAKSEQGCHTITEAGIEAMKAGVNLRSGPKSKHIAPKVMRNNNGRVKAWRAMRIRSKFSIPELVMLIAEGNEKDIINNLGKYVRALCKAGYLAELPRREAGSSLTSNGHKRYWLLPEKNTGPKAPIWRVAANTVYDPNTELNHSLVSVQEEALCG